MSSRTTAFQGLSIDQKLDLMEQLWASLSRRPHDIPVYEWQTDELDRRWQRYLQDPSAGSSWKDVVTRIRTRHGKSNRHPGRSGK